MKSQSNIQKLLTIMAQLRDPEKGCPWDLQQTFCTILPYTLEEVYEVAVAIESNDMSELKQELGDLLFQIVFYAQMAAEQSYFNFADIVDVISNKLVRRHPHVFADESYNNIKEQQTAWEKIKLAEKKSDKTKSVLDDINHKMPAYLTALKLQKRAATVGFDWQEVEPVLQKIHEELNELSIAIKTENKDEIEDELGDVLFSVVNLARHKNIDPEIALRRANKKFEQRFRNMEKYADDANNDLNGLDVDQLEALWQQAKQHRN